MHALVNVSNGVALVALILVVVSIALPCWNQVSLAGIKDEKVTWGLWKYCRNDNCVDVKNSMVDMKKLNAVRVFMMLSIPMLAGMLYFDPGHNARIALGVGSAVLCAVSMVLMVKIEKDVTKKLASQGFMKAEGIPCAGWYVCGLAMLCCLFAFGMKSSSSLYVAPVAPSVMPSVAVSSSDSDSQE